MDPSIPCRACSNAVKASSPEVRALMSARARERMEDPRNRALVAEGQDRRGTRTSLYLVFGNGLVKVGIGKGDAVARLAAAARNGLTDLLALWTVEDGTGIGEVEAACVLALGEVYDPASRSDVLGGFRETVWCDEPEAAREIVADIVESTLSVRPVAWADLDVDLFGGELMPQQERAQRRD
jgi:hypothetical protein